MKLHFEPNLQFQLDAIEAVCDLFKGQESCHSVFTVTLPTQDQQDFLLHTDALGIGNKLELLEEDILGNLREIQLRNGLRPDDTLQSMNFTVEMETGTGKTYVYLRTILELNKRFGFNKFVIVVPSVAIKEGVYKSLQITQDHLRSLYANEPYEYFLYDSAKLGQVRNFATSSSIQIMVVTVGAINKKDVNNLYKETEKINGEKPIDLIKQTNPIIIVDEPQSVDGGLEGRGKEALAAMNPLCTLRYSATHVEKHHMVYRLDAVDAYEQKLVKQIEVASAAIIGDHNKPYIKVLSVLNKRNVIQAKVELDVQQGQKVVRKELFVQDGDNLELVTNRAVYENCLIGEINCSKGREFVEIRFPGFNQNMAISDSYGGVDDESLARLMIRRTIKEHLDKELRLKNEEKGIKVLSLFFIDRVEKYRSYDAEGHAIKGEYARIFEEEYSQLIKRDEYNTIFQDVDTDSLAEEVHNGYFSIDKKGGWTDTEENNQTNRDNAERAYNLIMKDKEKLLSFETKLKFIFSHSALREGWDNPNVFQICVLREMGSELQRRQTIGRGLRLCVNQAGERIRGFNINTLTVIANEGYESFAENLQKEIEQDTGIRFGIVEKHQFATVHILDDSGKISPLGVEKSESIWSYLLANNYIDHKGKVQDKLRTALKDGSFVISDEFIDQLPQVKEILRKLAGKLDVKNADERNLIKVRKEVLYSPEFKELWDKIKHKTTYRVHFDNDKLISDCIEAIKNMPPITRSKLVWDKAGIEIGKGGVSATLSSSSAPETIEEGWVALPDVLSDLQDKTNLTRKSIAKILLQCDRLIDFKRNPQKFIEYSVECINKAKGLALVDGIKYQRIGDDYFYAQELFENEELFGYLSRNMLESKKSPYEYVVYDSATVEKPFAERLEQNEAVKVFAKLPSWFIVPTPLGSYNPDWAVLVETEKHLRLFFVVETKGDTSLEALRPSEKGKIACGKKHFQSLGNDVAFCVANNYDTFAEHLS
ncbi:MAG: DEAD/DEAH box helicase family protein [Candidatus Cloacimonetes bacterium]|nr:DEAD/DEAH box helicase family protein [Candidatus Cloacimonadota bacterium]